MDHLLTEARNPASMGLDELSTLDLVRLMNAEDARVAPAVATEAAILARAIDAIAERMKSGGRLISVGAGTSGRLAVLDAAECPPTFNVPPGLVIGVIAGGPTALTQAVEGAEDHLKQGAHDLETLGLTPNDAVLGIATSGRTPYVCGALAYARSMGALTMGFACTDKADLVPLVDLMIAPLVGPEVLTGSTRLKAGTATKMTLNILSTGVMVRLGKTYGNLMVDLRATNSKLKARAVRIVRQITGLNEEAVTGLLQSCGGEVKTAVVAHVRGISPELARIRLTESGGQLRSALSDPFSPRTAGATEKNLVLGIDGGGTGTVALLAELHGSGIRIIGRGEAGPSNLQGIGEQRATEALELAISQAFSSAGRPRLRVGAACLGLSGAGRPSDQAVFHGWAERYSLAIRHEVVGDADLLLAAGTPEGWGIGVVAGTGSIVWGRTAEGQNARAGGWGPLLGDEGSGYSLVVRALRALACSADGLAPSTALTPLFLRRFHVEHPSELIPIVYRQLDRPALAALAPLVLEAAEAHDPTASVLVDEEIQALGTQIASVARNLQFHNHPFPLALAGGLLLGSVPYRDHLTRDLTRRGLLATPLTLVAEPAQGALTRAERILPVCP